ncbi:MAG TPA: hypothetical protein VFA29_03450, partial [Candidatus Baltobacteraceae bacterium]|nr:hypothetical protein [Candidatus Baltobacteraceae bacterium]
AQAEHRAEADLTRLAKDVPMSVSTAGMLQTLERNAAIAGVAIEGVEPQPAQPAAVPAAGNAVSAPATGPRLVQDDVLIRVSGRFRDLLRFVAALSHNRILIRVAQTDVALSTAAGTQPAGEPRLDAAVHATLYRLFVRPMEERSVATP